ncbi:hypothetical protein BDZ89DRAFT_1023599 [Hymenopellis radicata]|nr:hypothetical protein BDZ89DRAFT_1023599 [Hymenopellis radicata]
MPDVAHLFVKLRRANKAAKVESSSGDEPLTHEMVGRGLNPKQGSLRVTDTYIVAGGVNAKCLLRATRNSLMEVAEFVHAESEEAGLYDEQWSITISPKHISRGNEKGFKVTIHYSACPKASSMRRDPHVPVALDRAKGVPGLMTILQYDQDR